MNGRGQQWHDWMIWVSERSEEDFDERSDDADTAVTDDVNAIRDHDVRISLEIPF